MSKVAIVGSGFIGRAWAITFARAGHDVSLWDPDPSAPKKAIDYIAALLPELAENDLLGRLEPRSLLARLKTENDLERALSGATHVQENAPEKLEVKVALFKELDWLAPPESVIASSSSALLPSLFTKDLAGRHRCLVVHPLNPPYVIPAAEVVPAPWTSPDIVTRTRDFLVAAGQAPIVMSRELDGFIMNRLQGALLEEAFRLVADGYASPEDIDVGLREGLALRWSFMGPFETIDLNAPGGVRDYVERYQDIYARLFPQMQRRVDWAGDVLKIVERERRGRIPKDDLGKRQAWRDKRLMALAAHKRAADKKIGK
jgi:3-hydroxyacyl-CoA dehydrogenase